MTVFVLVHTNSYDCDTTTKILGVFKTKAKALERFKKEKELIIKEYKEQEYEEDFRETDGRKGHFYISATEGWDNLDIERVIVED